MQFNVLHQFFGPNMHSDYQACERLVQLSREEMSDLHEQGEAILDVLVAGLRRCGMIDSHLVPLLEKFPQGGRHRFAFLFNGTALALQRFAGHRVGRSRYILSADRPWQRTLFETEDAQVGANASRVALLLMAQVIPSLEYKLEGVHPNVTIADVIMYFHKKAKACRMPRDTRELIAAAGRAGMPWIRLDQAPFETGKRKHQVRALGGLALGQGRHRKIIDGTFCRTGGKQLRPYVRDRVSLARMAVRFGAVVPHVDGEPDTGSTLAQAVQIVERLGYPVVIKSKRRHRGAGVTTKVRDIEQLMQAVTEAHRVSHTFIVERMVAGRDWRIIFAGGEVVGALQDGEEVGDLLEIHESLRQLSGQVAANLRVGLLVLSVVSPDISQPLEAAGGAVVDLDPAPELDRILASDSALWEKSMDAFVQWLFPPGTETRIPIIAVTGSNGKTTTSCMLAHMARHAGLVTGLSCSEGLFVRGGGINKSYARKFIGSMRFRLMRNRRIELAVMEYYLSRIKNEGFPFEFCNIGVHTNVVPEHLQVGMDTAEAIAEAKASVLDRARDGVVLNADDEHTPRLLKRFQGRRVALTSIRRDLADVRGTLAPDACCVLLEQDGDHDRIVIHDGEVRVDLMGVADIPATFGGTAGFNVENALQVIAAGQLLGLDHDRIREAMGSFEMGFEQTPGRLNIHDGWPFRVIMDYAHNADGIRKLCAFTDAQEVAGRRILMFSVSGDRWPEEIQATTAAAVGHFDHYVLRSYPQTRGRSPENMPVLMQEVLLAEGVVPEQITIEPNHIAAIQRTLAMGRPGDLLVMTPGINEMEDMWERILAGPVTGG